MWFQLVLRMHIALATTLCFPFPFSFSIKICLCTLLFSKELVSIFIQLNYQVLNYWKGLQKIPKIMMVAMLNYQTTMWCGEACAICANDLEKCLQCSQKTCWNIYNLHKWYGKMSTNNLAKCLRLKSTQLTWWNIYNLFKKFGQMSTFAHEQFVECFHLQSTLE